jgi:chromosome segregation ATPase
MPPGSPGPAAGCATSQEISDLAARAALSDRLQADLHEAHASMARLQGQLDSFERDKETASAACSENIQKCEQDARGRLEALEKDLDSARGEAESARASRERAASLGTENAKLKSDNGAVSAQIAELRKAMASLQDLDRRRDGYLNSVSRRYHEITEQFRAMTSTIDSNRASGSSFSDVALSRIQNATALAEEDLRRLNELNAQAHQIENRMAKN